MQSLNVQQRPPGYDLFFAPLAVELNPNDYEMVHTAYIFSKFGHAKEVRKGGSRYFDHPKASAWVYIDELGGCDPRVIIDNLLHDISEDTYLLSPFRISLNFGKDIALDVRALTKLLKGEETIEEYLQRIISRGPWTIITKLCDRLHNLRTLNVFAQEEQEQKIAETQQYHLKLLIPALRACGGEWETYVDTLKEKIDNAIEILNKTLNAIA